MCFYSLRKKTLNSSGVDHIREEILIGVAIAQRVSLADLSATEYSELHRRSFNELSCASRQPTALLPVSITP